MFVSNREESTGDLWSVPADGGAEPATVTVVEIEDLPLAYLPGDARRVRVRVVGDAAPRTS